MFEVGQTVWCVVRGKGEVVAINKEDACPVKVKFETSPFNYNSSFTTDGRYMEYQARSLFFSEPKIDALTEPPFVPTYVKGDVVTITARHNPITNICIVSYETERHLHLCDINRGINHFEKNSIFDWAYRIQKQEYRIKKIGTFTQAD